MSHRLTKIYTRTGDAGTTGLSDGSRVPKNIPRLEVIGTLDELNSAIGVLLAHDLPSEIRNVLDDVQHDLFDFGGELSMPGHTILSAAHVKHLETMLDRCNSGLAPLKEFILPAGSRAAALAHMARTICRRAERSLITLHQAEPVTPVMLQYLNRLSDLLFVIARLLNRHDRGKDVYWRQGKNRGE